jgi:hypothetical protein
MKAFLLAGIAVCAWAQTDPYRGLRDGAPSEAFLTENVELKRDVGTITLKNGQIVFLPEVLGHHAIGVFVGEGVFRMKPAVKIEEKHLTLVTGKPELEEAFDSAVIFFTDGTFEEVKGQAPARQADGRAAEVLKELRDKLRRERTAGDIGNVEAEVLSELLNPKRGASFRVYMHGKHNPDLRFFTVPSGAMPREQSPEETALVNVDVGGNKGGIWYLSHLASEWEKQTASSGEDKRTVQANHFSIDTEVGHAGALSGTTDLEFTAVIDGTRMIRFDLLPSLRVKKVTDGEKHPVGFIQESVKGDGSFYVVLPRLERGKNYTLHFEYEGNKVIYDAGGGNFFVAERSAWYPNVNVFNDHALYDLKFRYPKQYTLVAVGQRVSESKDGSLMVSEWKSGVKMAVAGFNYGEYKKKSVTDEVSKYDLEVFTTEQVPSMLRPFAERMALSPSAMAQNALVDAENSMRLFEKTFGDCPFGRLAVTQQPAFGFGQSWPTLVYLPVSAFLDPTQRFSMLGAREFKFSQFIDEVTPHEIAHQWWGHMVGWASYHDQWLSEGLAEFSAGLFMEATRKPADVDKFWDRLRLQIVEKNNFGISANDAGPIWLGYRLNTEKTPGAARGSIYPKGAYLAQMLRMLMRDEKTGDQDFNSMMRDFVQTYLYRNASSEGFMAAVAKHIKPAMDLDGTHTMAWFTREWIYGTDLPKYRLEYSLKPADGGKLRFTGTLTQSEVSPDFVMRVPIYMDFDGRALRVGGVVMKGNMTSPEINVVLPKKPKRVLLSANHDVLAAEAVVKEVQ